LSTLPGHHDKADDGHEIGLVASSGTRVLSAIAVLLVVASVTGQIVAHSTGHNTVYGLIPAFDLDGEANIPTFYSGALLLVASALLALVAVLARKTRAPFANSWAVLALGFLFLSCDELGCIHEMMVQPMRELLGGQPHGVLYSGWVVPATLGVLIVVVSFWRFWRHLPDRTRRLVLVAGLLFVGGSVGMEVIGGLYRDRHGLDFVNAMISTVEESAEMAGVIIFIHAMMGYIGEQYGLVVLRFGGRA